MAGKGGSEGSSSSVSFIAVTRMCSMLCPSSCLAMSARCFVKKRSWRGLSCRHLLRHNITPMKQASIDASLAKVPALNLLQNERHGGGQRRLAPCPQQLDSSSSTSRLQHVMDIAMQLYSSFQCSICWPCSVLALCRCWRLCPWHHVTRLLHQVERASAGVQRTARGGVPDPNPWYLIWVAIRNPGLHLNNSSTLQYTPSPLVRAFPTRLTGQA